MSALNRGTLIQKKQKKKQRILNLFDHEENTGELDGPNNP